MRRPTTVLGCLKVGRVIQRNRLDKYYHTSVFMRHSDALAKHRWCVGSIRRTGDNDPRNIRQNSQRIVIMEMPAKTFLIRQSGNP